MKFIQIMEFTGSADEAIKSINNYIDIAGQETRVKKATVCEDRDTPGRLLQVIEFDSYEDAMINIEAGNKKTYHIADLTKAVSSGKKLW